MTEPTRFTTQQAADPSTPAQLLADMAALRPDLRPIVAANPTAYPGLLEWLGSLGEPPVDAALAARAAAEAGSPAASSPGVFQQPAQPWQGQQGQQGQPAQQWQGQQGQPAQQWQGQESQQWPGQPGQPGQPYAYRVPGAAPAKKRNTALIVVLVVLGVLLLLGIGGVFAARALFGSVVENINTSAGTAFSAGDSYGSDASLDPLWDTCEAGDFAACDELYWGSPGGSGYEDFGMSCGGRVDDSGGDCVGSFGESGAAGVDVGGAYGDDASLDALWDACEGGDMAACDELYFESPFGSAYEEFGNTCGNRVEWAFSCVEE